MNSETSNNQQVFVIDGSTGFSTGTSPAVPRRRIKKTNQQPVVDVIVVLVALPALTILALLLEANTRGDWLASAESRYTVLGLGCALAVVCLAICIYITSRLGGKMWSGAIPSDGSGPHYSYYNSHCTVDELNDKPPSYEACVMSFDIPPPSYHTIVIEHDIKEVLDYDSCSKMNPIQHI